MEELDDKHYCGGDEELAAMLHKFFVVEGHDEVIIQHPQDGERLITKDEYFNLQKHLKAASDMSPADRMVESKRLKNKKQIQFRTAMIEAKHYTVDLDDEDSFGYDVNGVKVDIEGMDFVPVDQYLKGIKAVENELGAYVSESMHKPPVRILKKEDQET